MEFVFLHQCSMCSKCISYYEGTSILPLNLHFLFCPKDLNRDIISLHLLNQKCKGLEGGPLPVYTLLDSLNKSSIIYMHCEHTPWKHQDKWPVAHGLDIMVTLLEALTLLVFS